MLTAKMPDMVAIVPVKKNLVTEVEVVDKPMRSHEQKNES